MTGNNTLKLVSSAKCFAGLQKIFSHESVELKCSMNFSVYLPPKAEDAKVPVLYFLSGLTCSEKNFVEKSGFQKYASEHGLMVVGPDTSPRGCNIEGEDETWDFGTGAGFYVDATEPKWKDNYRMFSYVTKELRELVNANFPALPDKQSITGHSMGGHGALICAFKCPGQYKSVSALAPICNPTSPDCPWGQKALKGYLGSDQKLWQEYDATCLVKNYKGPPYDILIDQGKDDNFLESQLYPHNFVIACSENRMPVCLRFQEGYDHSYYFISTFIGDHIAHHAKYLV